MTDFLIDPNDSFNAGWKCSCDGWSIVSMRMPGKGAD
jgi:hypothetical protein